MPPVKIVIVGGGSVLWSPMLARDFCLNEGLCGEIVLYDHKLEAAQQAKQLYDKYNTDQRWTIEVAEVLGQALAGTNVVLVTINHGGMAGTKIDLELPASYGLTQTVGDTVSAGGISRAIRNVPAIAEIAAAMHKYCPGAWLINCSNPMTVMCSAASTEHDNVIGYCHEWQFFGQFLRQLWLGTGFRLRPVIFGLNHFAGVVDLFEVDSSGTSTSVLDHTIARLPELSMTDEEFEKFGPFENFRQLSRRLAGDWRLLPFPGDRHLVEFLEGQWIISPSNLRQLLIKVTTLEQRRDGADKASRQYQRWLAGTEQLPQGHSMEELDYIVAALSGGDEYETNLVVPAEMVEATGLPSILELPGCPWEVSCHLSQGRVVPVEDLGPSVLSRTIARSPFYSLSNTHGQICNLVHNGILLKSPERLMRALQMDPSASYQLKASGRDAQELVNDLIRANCNLMYVPPWA